MPLPRCVICDQGIFPNEKIIYNSGAYHKSCFKCTECRSTLSLLHVQSYGGKLYCISHLPKPPLFNMIDSIYTFYFKQTQILVSDAHSWQYTCQKGTGERPDQSFDLQICQDIESQKLANDERTSQQYTIRKGTGETPNYDLYAYSIQSDISSQQLINTSTFNQYILNEGYELQTVDTPKEE